MKITAKSHLDHGLGDDHAAWLLVQFADRSSFFVETIELPAHLSSLRSALYGPLAGDEPIGDVEVTRQCRGGRAGLSRMVERPSRETRLVTVIAGPDDDGAIVMYTAYGGPCAPREPFDASLVGEAKAESEAFWSVHALATG